MSKLRHLREFADAFSEAGTFYILGAGASIPIVPSTAELGKLVLDKFIAFGSYSPSRIEPDLLTSRIVRIPPAHVDELRFELAQRVPPSYVAAAIPYLLSPRLLGEPAQYSVFNRAARPSVLFSFNNDGLAAAHTRGHLVLEPHGRTLSKRQFERFKWHRLLSILNEHPSIKPPTIPGLVLPVPEPESVLMRREYGLARRLIPIAKSVVLIGYSFGGMDDIHFYRLLTKLVNPSTQNLLVLDPFPDRTVGGLRETLSSDRVKEIPAYWGCLSRAILSPPDCKKSHPLVARNFCTRCVEYRYEQLLDANGPLGS
jgi:hypothetical protein